MHELESDDVSGHACRHQLINGKGRKKNFGIFIYFVIIQLEITMGLELRISQDEN